jgi:hypothetical protein
MNRNLLYFLALIIIIVFILFQKDYLKSHCIQQQHELNDLQFKGVLVKKFLDSTNHNRPMFIIKDSSGESEINLYSNTTLNKLYRLSTVNDTLIKFSGKDTIILKSKEHFLTFKIDLDCY